MTPYPQFGITNEIVDNIQNWSDAIFASPRILCASDPSYSERITIKSQIWSLILDVKLKPNSFTKHKSQVIIQVMGDHPRPTNPIDDIIYRISSEDNIIVVAITFLLYSYSPLDPYETIFDQVDIYGNNLKIDYEDKLII